MRLDKVSSEMFKDFSRTQLKKWILEGRILLNSELALPKDNVHVDDVIEINPTTEKKNFWEPEDICFDVMAEEKDYFFINNWKGVKILQ